MSDWITALERTLHVPNTPANRKFFTTWQRWEGGATNNSASYNWLNTTHGPGRSINSVGVKAFGSFDQGIRSLAETLNNGRYKDILDALASGDPYAAAPSAGLQVWVSGRPDGNPGYAAKILGGHAATPLVARATSWAKEKKAAVNAVSPNAAWDQAMHLIFHDDPMTAEIMAQIDDHTAQRAGIVSPRGSVAHVLYDAPGIFGKVSKVASTQLGKPYVFGSGPSTASFDCSDLIQWAYKQVGISLPRTTYDQIHVGRSVKGKKLMPGDLIFPHRGHVVMYVGHGKVIAAPHTGTVVQYQDVPSNPLEVRRVIK